MRGGIILSAAMLTFLLYSLTDAARQTLFQPLVPEEQTLAWLKERNHDAEALGEGRYRIYWRDYSRGPLRDEHGKRYSVRAFDWGPRGGKADVLVSSRVEWVESAQRTTPDTGLPEYRYVYRITSLETSQHRVHTLWIHTPDLPRNWYREISNPPGWRDMGQPPQYEHGGNSVTWRPKGEGGIYGIDPGKSQSGFVFQCPSVPGIITASVWTTGGDSSGMENVRTLHYYETAPRGAVVGPVAIPVGTSASELTRRLETLLSQSVTLGWLDEAAAVPLKQHLANSLTALGKNQPSAARREIQAFASVLDALEERISTDAKLTGTSGSPSEEGERLQVPADLPILAEALTLLQTNAAYLLTTF